MRDQVQSLMTLGWAAALFGAQQAQRVFTSRSAGTTAAADLADLARTAEERLSGPFRDLYRAAVKAQSGMLDAMFGGLPAVSPEPGPPTPPPATGVGWGPMPAAENPPDPDPDLGRTDARPHVVLGEGLAAGFGDFALAADGQRASFPNVLTRQMGVRFRQPLFCPPGLGQAPGFPAEPAIVPAYLQADVLDGGVPEWPYSNLSVPGFRVADVVTARPSPPLVRPGDTRQTLANFILGLPNLARGGARPTQLEAALAQSPACAIVALGYTDVLEPAVGGDRALLPSAAELREHFARVLGPLRDARAELLVLTVPDPMDTAYFPTIPAAADFLRVEPAVLERAYRPGPGARMTVPGLLAAAGHILAGRFDPLPAGGLVCGETARAVTERVRELNAELSALAREHGAVVYDLHGLFRRVRESGVAAGGRRLTADYFGGFYSLNGCYPGAAGHAVIAAELVDLVNATHGTAYPRPDVSAATAADPVAAYRPPRGRALNWDDVTRGDRPSASHEAEPLIVHSAPVIHTAPPLPLRLPPDGVQELPLVKAESYHADGIRIVHCRDARDAKFGGTADTLFGGLALFGSHLAGVLQFTFAPPVGRTSRFEINWGNGLIGDDGVLSAPRFFRLAANNPRVAHWPGTVVSGTVNLDTGDITDLDVRVVYVNSALGILAAGNPNLPKPPMIQFPGEYGSAWAKFEPRADGKLDFTFHGRTFLPLGKDLGGDPVVWPLPFGAAGDHPASVPAAGTAMHPQLRLSTRPSAEPDAPIDVPVNTVREFTLHTRNSSFGDLFTLNTPELAGDARGRSHVTGRLAVQFGERFGDSVPVAVAALPPGGLLDPPPRTPLDDAFPSRLPAGLVGHDEFLRFPRRTYFLDGVSLIDDPFDLTVGVVNVRTGAFVGDVLHRGFIGQNLFFALVRTEPRTPGSSFFFRGPARFDAAPDGGLVYRFNGEVHIPYPEGFKFPAPDLATAYVVGPNSALDPFLRLRAATPARPRRDMSGGADDVLASNGNRFGYRYAIPADPASGKAAFAYTNHAQDGTFTLHAMAWHAFTRSSATAPEPDTVTFTGYGAWSRDPGGCHPVAVQISTARGAEYVSVQVGGGLVSNVNTKPAADADTYA